MIIKNCQISWIEVGLYALKKKMWKKFSLNFSDGIQVVQMYPMINKRK